MSFGDCVCTCIDVEDSETEEGLRAEEATGGRLSGALLGSQECSRREGNQGGAAVSSLGNQRKGGLCKQV